MPGLDGVAATRCIAARHPAIAVLALTMYDDDASVSAVLGAHQAELVAAIRAVARGEAVFGAQVADRVLAHFTTPPAQRPAPPELTDRERLILAMLASGHTTSDIAAHLALAPTSVRNRHAPLPTNTTARVPDPMPIWTAVQHRWHRSATGQYWAFCAVPWLEDCRAVDIPRGAGAGNPPGLGVQTPAH
jgi:CheY-like chemotaxis protein